MFTQQHYKAIAAVIWKRVTAHAMAHALGDQMADSYRIRHDELSGLAVQLAALFADDNPKFRRDVFIAACGLLDTSDVERALGVAHEGCAGCGTTDTGRFNHVSGVFCSDCWGERFECENWPGVAVRIVRHPSETVHPECPGHAAEDEPNTSTLSIGEVVYCDGSCQEAETEVQEDRVVIVMVGDDREHEVGVDTLTRLAADAYCHECGQTSCGHGRVEV